MQYSTNFIWYLLIFLCCITACTFQKRQEIRSEKNTILVEIPSSIKDINWGSVEEGNTIYAYLDLKNTTTSTYLLKRVRTGDGGCYASINNHTVNHILLPPNSVTTLQIEQHTEKRSGKIHRNICLFFVENAKESFQSCFKFYGKVNHAKD